jgi:hypothetical protein
VFLLAGLSASAAPPQEKGSPSTRSAPSAKSNPVLDKTGDAEQVRLINKHLAEKWKANKLTPSPRASDAEFIRRVSLDIIGRIAKPEEIARFYKDPENTRRAQLIERLLKSDEYARNWANVWTVWLLTRSGQSLYHDQMHKWLEKQFSNDGASYKEIVTQLLTATGKTNENGAVNYVLAHLGEATPPNRAAQEGKFSMVPITSRTARLFLGVQIQCAQCHAHPFNKEWKQAFFWQLNAFFRQVDAPRGRPGGNRMMPQGMVLELVDNTSLNPDGEVFFEERNGRIVDVSAGFPFDTEAARREADATQARADRRQELAKLITNSKYFGKAYVNRIWAHFFGRGFTNPVDDFTPENEVSHPELLDELAAEFVHYGYDPRRLIRWICNSDAYNLSSVANKTNAETEAEPLFSRMLLKAMTPEQLFESFMIATEADKFEKDDQKRKDLRQKWMQSLTTNFGDDEGNEATFNGTVVQALLLMNGDQLNQAVSRVAPLYKKMGTPDMINHLYLATLNRPPTPREVSLIRRVYNSAPVSAKDRNQLTFFQDLFWALLNSNEFVLNH